jgi:hypothetical protein
MNSSAELPVKKRYSKPELSRYGNLTEMTAANVMTTGAMDAMTGSGKTS